MDFGRVELPFPPCQGGVIPLYEKPFDPKDGQGRPSRPYEMHVARVELTLRVALHP